MSQAQQKSFHDLLRYAWAHSSFYRELYASHGLKEQDLGAVSVADLPIVSKRILMDHFDAAVTDARLKKQDLEHWIEEDHDPFHNFSSEFVVTHSSGSSGQIGIFVHDQRAWQIMACAMAGRLPLPENYPSGRTRAVFYLASHGHFGGASTAARMPRDLYDLLILSVLDPQAQVVERLNAFQPHRIHGYASTVARLAEFQIQGLLHIRPRRIFIGGDKLTDCVARKIRRAWDAPVYEFYSASESKYIALREPGQVEMKVIDELNLMEVLSGCGEAVPAGDRGRVVLTNLINRALPIIRYDLGDCVQVGVSSNGSNCAAIRKIWGRVDDASALPVRLADGSRDAIDPIALIEFFVPGLGEIQFIAQRADRARIEYTAEQDLDAPIRQEFQRLLDLKGASGVSFDVVRVPAIPADPRTGKLRLVRKDGAAVSDRVSTRYEVRSEQHVTQAQTAASRTAEVKQARRVHPPVSRRKSSGVGVGAHFGPRIVR